MNKIDNCIENVVLTICICYLTKIGTKNTCVTVIERPLKLEILDKYKNNND